MYEEEPGGGGSLPKNYWENYKQNIFVEKFKKLINY